MCAASLFPVRTHQARVVSSRSWGCSLRLDKGSRTPPGVRLCLPPAPPCCFPHSGSKQRGSSASWGLTLIFCLPTFSWRTQVIEYLCNYSVNMYPHRKCYLNSVFRSCLIFNNKVRRIFMLIFVNQLFYTHCYCVKTVSVSYHTVAVHVSFPS